MQETRGIRDSDTYVFLPTKFEMPATAAADRMTVALEELTSAIKKHKDHIPVTDKSVNKAIQALSKLLSPKTATTNDVPVPRVLLQNGNEEHVPSPRVNNNNDRVL